MKPNAVVRTVNHCGYNYSGIRVAVVFPAKEGDCWHIANRQYGGYNIPYATVADAKAYCNLRHYPNITEWREEQVAPSDDDGAT